MKLTTNQEYELNERTAIMLDAGVPKEEVDALALADLLDDYPELSNNGQLQLI